MLTEILIADNRLTKILLIVIWILGTAFAMLSSKRLRDYKDYDSPYFMLIVGIFLCITMSWAYVYLLVLNNECEPPLWMYHDCQSHADIDFEEQYVRDDNGNILEHHTFRVYKCRVCGKTWKEQLQ